jgi:hypothetical protein
VERNVNVISKATMSITVDFYISLYKKDMYSAAIGIPFGEREYPLDRQALGVTECIDLLGLVTNNGRRGPETNFDGT